jgi:hypothetical protein
MEDSENLLDIRYTLSTSTAMAMTKRACTTRSSHADRHAVRRIQAYAADTVGTPIAYDSHAYPYFFMDTNANGVVDPEEAVRENGFTAWTPRLLRAAYNYQWASKDPGSFAHNGMYTSSRRSTTAWKISAAMCQR